MRNQLKMMSLVLSGLFFLSQLVACQVGVKDNPSDRPRSQKNTGVVAQRETEATTVSPQVSTAQEKQPEESSRSPETAKTDKTDKTAQGDQAEPKGQKDKTESTTALATTTHTDAPEPEAPSVAEVQQALKAEDFTFYVNNLIKEPEPESVVYGDKKVGKAELTVLYAYFKSQKEADEAIANLLESDMIGKAISFGAKLDKPVDKSGEKVYTVTLKSFLATARAEMRQEGRRIGLVLLYKKNDEVTFAPYFELMGFEDK